MKRWATGSRWMPKPLEETEPVIATVDHADIRGLITTLLVSVGHLPRSRDEYLFQAPNVFEGYANTGAASHRMARLSILYLSCCHRHAANGVCLAMAQMKAASSRAMATVTWFWCLPLLTSVR